MVRSQRAAAELTFLALPALAEGEVGEVVLEAVDDLLLRLVAVAQQEDRLVQDGVVHGSFPFGSTGLSPVGH